jgi:hypothetical protein
MSPGKAKAGKSSRPHMTQWMLATLGLAIVGQIVYQIGQRSVPANASPLAVLAVVRTAVGAIRCRVA